MSAAQETTSTRDRVLAAALSAFARRGVEATSLDAVAAEIGIRKQTILYYFPSKDALVKGVIEHAAQEVGTVLGASALRHRQEADRVEAVVDAVYRMGADRPEMIVLLREVSRLGPVQATDLQDAIEPLIARAVAALAVDGVEPERARDVLLSAVAKVVGQATEVQVLRDLGVEPTVSDLRRRRRGVDHDVAGGDGVAAGVVEAEAVGADVAGDHVDPSGHHLLERRPATEVLAHAVEAVVPEDLPVGALLDGALASGPDEQHELAVGDRAQQPLDERGAQEAGGAGDGDALAGEVVANHVGLSTIW